ncbi:YbhB/YbcL family Raf kinase inhibitor-like protein [Kitasatospora sp. NBC_01287]|uniref:YbhB/YbcL family Raf kinase inhibitor-like protein n=1 Tax=Kitasatospora sp. NBC_01287 TaxID=2903573 RepID=UPI00224C887C|nr:YbhB/YbcL family Raf kinase inhibitor-like protein [Kitasatospora sp. NBC_01287]MCX4750751.1 YbhB/YbcL family Raf kinase inhibitor-like protein [Kitasatospora sp. NBC_01287]
MTRPPLPHDFQRPVPGFTVTSTDLTDGGLLPEAQVLAGGDTSPQLSWAGFPPGTQSFAVTCFDPDAPTGSGWWHWVLFDIPADVTSLPTGAGTGDFAGLPAGAVQARNDYGTKNFGGAAPPPGHGPHRYVFSVTAVGAPKLGLDSDTSPAAIGGTLGFLAVGRGTITATYENE